MPFDLGSAINGAFKFFKDRVWSRAQRWMEQCVSAAGKEVLIKTVAQAIPTFFYVVLQTTPWAVPTC
jgi:hypothetical protein